MASPRAGRSTAPVSSIVSPATTASSGLPSSSNAPATRRTENPSSPSAHAHLRASTDTPSFPPSRYETTAACGAIRRRYRRVPESKRLPALPSAASVEDLRSEPQQRRRGRRMTHIRPKLAWRVGPVVVVRAPRDLRRVARARTRSRRSARSSRSTRGRRRSRSLPTRSRSDRGGAATSASRARLPSSRTSPCRPSRAARSRSARWVRASRSSSGSGTTAASPRSSATSSGRPRTSATTTRARASCATPARR